MADTSVPINALGIDVATAAASAVPIVAANRHVIAGAGDSHKLFVTITSTAVTAKAVTFEAGDGLRAPLGPLVVSFEEDEVKHFVIESARFAKSNGDVVITVEAGSAGSIVAYRLPRAS